MKSVPLWFATAVICGGVFLVLELGSRLIRRFQSHPVDDCPTTLPLPPALKEKCEAAERIVDRVRRMDEGQSLDRYNTELRRLSKQPELDEHDYAVFLRMLDELRRRMANAAGALQSAERELKLAKQRLDDSAEWLNKLDKLMSGVAAKVGNLDLHGSDGT